MMTSVNTELGSTRLVDEPNNSNETQSADLQRSSAPAEIEARLGGKFSADLAALLKKQSPKPIEESSQLTPDAYPDHTIRQFALIRIQIGNIEGAIDFIQRHAPEEMDWLNAQLRPRQIVPPSVKSQPVLTQIKVIQRTVLIDAEAGRIAKVVGQFGLFRAWAYAHAVDSGDGRVEREELENVWQDAGVATSKRHSRRLIKEGINQGYWTLDARTGRIYLSGQLRVAKQLVKSAMSSGLSHLVETNKPGKRRVEIDLSGGIQESSAQLYAAWMATKDAEREGITISRDMLCALWNVSIPTLLKWEEIAHIRKQANYAQQNDTSIDHVPAHAYLTLNRNGSHSAAWRLPNTYTITDKSIQQHPRTGKSKKVRKVVQREIMQAERRGAIGDAALPSSNKLYFTEQNHSKIDPFHACSDYLRKVGRHDGDMKLRRYFYVGKRHGVQIFEPYDLQKNAQQTYVGQRMIRRESDCCFVDARESYHIALQMEA
ncbi:MAG: hypothetical protein RLP44_17200 [Aggregatilineales bacterium]